MTGLYYMIDCRKYKGKMHFLIESPDKLTTNPAKAAVFEYDEAADLHKENNFLIPWPKSYIDSKIRGFVMVNDADIFEAYTAKKSPL